MNHFHHEIQGWCNFESLYQEMVSLAETNSHFVEIGAWKGRSTAFMCVEIINSDKNIRFDCIDTWQGSHEHQRGEMFEDEDAINGTLFQTFSKNLSPVKGYYFPIRMPSIEASKFYEDESLDFVFIDAAHDYESVKQDIETWLPKVKPGKFLGGDDYNIIGVREAVHSTLGFKIVKKGNSEWPSWLYYKK